MTLSGTLVATAAGAILAPPDVRGDDTVVQAGSLRAEMGGVAGPISFDDLSGIPTPVATTVDPSDVPGIPVFDEPVDDAVACPDCEPAPWCGQTPCCPADPDGLLQRIHANHRASGACWTARAETLGLWRSSPRGRPLFSNAIDGAIASTALDSNQLVSDPLVAPRLSLFRDDGCRRVLELNYLWAGNFYSERALPFVPAGYATSPPGIYGNEWGPATDTSLDAAQAKLLANLQTAELNVRERFLHGMAQFIVGFRWLQWNESLQMQDAFTNPVDPSIIGADFYRTDCFNNLYGGQIGIDAVLLGSRSGFRVDGLVKAGAFYNDALQKSEYGYVDTSPDVYAAANRVGSPDGAAFVGEVGMTAVVPVHCNVNLRVGYFGLWIEGLAQPTNQLSGQNLSQGGSDTGALDLTGGALVQGLSLGLEGRW